MLFADLSLERESTVRVLAHPGMVIVKFSTVHNDRGMTLVLLQEAKVRDATGRFNLGLARQ